MKRVYLDHSATTRVRPEVADLVLEYMTVQYGNPSSIHSMGCEAKKGLEKARKQIAVSIGAQPEEIFFTSGGTESDNLAIRGVALQYRSKGKHIITSAVEHHAVLDTCRSLEKEGFLVSVVPVDKFGMVSIEDVKKVITPETILISIMHVNNEVGTIQPIEEIAALAKERDIIFHTDAVQSFGKLPIDVGKMNIDLLTASGHKIYGPKGTGFLYVRKGVNLYPLTFGGGQERSRRPGTENLPGIVGLGLAGQLAVDEMNTEMARLSEIRDDLINRLLKIPDVRLNGHSQKRIASNVNISVEFVEGESLLLSLDLKGITASSGSACTSGSLDPSHVLLAMGLTREIAQGSIRMTLGKENNKEDIEQIMKVLPQIIDRLRMMSPLYHKSRKSKTSVD